jgi:hypothetical protein
MAILYTSCAKDQTLNPVKNNLFKISLTTPFANNANSAWKQILGGEAIIQFYALPSDTLTASVIKDSLDLKNIAIYNKQLTAGNYNITLNTKSTAVADTFIRFNAQANAMKVNKDMSINLTATSSDGVITISKNQISNLERPTFTPTGTSTVYQFGLANGYYFIYVKDAVNGRIKFIEATTGDLYLKDITISATNQYDISAILHSTAISIRSNHF